MRPVAAILLTLVLATPASAQLELYGFVEAALGVRTASVDAPPPEWDATEGLPPVWTERPDLLLQEARIQLKADIYGDVGEAHLKLDVVGGATSDSDTETEVREGYVKFSTFADKLEVRAGRQPTTWGTGDLLFVNDLFPKDWQSFFLGRADEYLKRPSDALRFTAYGLPMDVDVVYTPEFAPDRIPTGERLAFWTPALVPTDAPGGRVEDGEVAVRASRYVAGFNAALYAYRGFWKSPQGLRVDEDGPTAFFHPKLRVYGASLRGGRFGGIVWVEGGWYDSAEDRDAVDPFVPDSEVRALAGYERQWWSDFTGGAQVYLESPEEGDERVLVTVRARQQFLSQTLTAGIFVYHSTTDEDGHVRASVDYAYSDALTLTAGANVFYGDDRTTTFGMNDGNDNVFTRVRFGF